MESDSSSAVASGMPPCLIWLLSSGTATSELRTLRQSRGELPSSPHTTCIPSEGAVIIVMGLVHAAEAQVQCDDTFLRTGITAAGSHWQGLCVAARAAWRTRCDEQSFRPSIRFAGIDYRLRRG